MLIKPVYIFFIEAKVQNVVGTEVYGAYFSYLNFVFLFQFLNDPGLQNWNAQFVPKNKEKISAHITHLMYIKVILAIIFLGVLLPLAYLFGFDDTYLLLLLGANLILSSIFMLLRTVISGMGFYRVDSWLSALDKVLMILILGYVLYISDKALFSIHQFAGLQCTAYVIALFVAFLIVFLKIKIKFEVFNHIEFVKILGQCLPYILTLLFMTAYNKLDGVMLAKMLDDNHFQSGVYASAYRIYDAANMTGYLFAALLLPMYASHLYSQKILKDLLNTSFKYVFLMSFLVVCVIFWYGEDILKFIYIEYIPDFYNTLKWLILSYMLVAIAYIYGSLLVAAGKINRLNIVFGIGLMINIVLNLIFIPLYQAAGAAMATLITQMSVLAGQIYLTKKEMDLFVDKKLFTQLVPFSLICVVVFMGLKSIINWDWTFNMGLSILICLLLSFIFKIIDFKDGTTLVANRNISK